MITIVAYNGNNKITVVCYNGGNFLPKVAPKTAPKPHKNVKFLQIFIQRFLLYTPLLIFEEKNFASFEKIRLLPLYATSAVKHNYCVTRKRRFT